MILPDGRAWSGAELGNRAKNHLRPPIADTRTETPPVCRRPADDHSNGAIQKISPRLALPDRPTHPDHPRTAIRGRNVE
jgi:hypothetical protein